MQPAQKARVVASGALAGVVAGIPQVLATQLVAGLLADTPRERADIGPRFVQRLANHLGESLPAPLQWLLGAVFHFGYGAGWGSLYALAASYARLGPQLGAPALATVIYAAAFSPWGAATKTRTERPPGRRPTGDTVLHLTAALTFSAVTALTFEWLRHRPRPPSVDGAPA
jgi:hypothetical protein